MKLILNKYFSIRLDQEARKLQDNLKYRVRSISSKRLYLNILFHLLYYSIAFYLLQCGYVLRPHHPLNTISTMFLDMFSIKYKLFIYLGPFHIIMAYFKAVGKITDCGFTNVMIESNLLTNGSFKGFLEENISTRLQPLMALGLESLHFQSFSQIENIKFAAEDRGNKKTTNLEKVPLFKFENDEVPTLFKDYSQFKKQTLNG